MSLHVLIRSDASSTIGVGHIMRDLVLANILVAKGFTVDFACINLKGHLITKIQGAGHHVYTLTTNTSNELIALLKTASYDWLILDHYGIDMHFEKAIKKELSIKILSFDDTYTKHYCDILLNHGFQAKPISYQSLADTDTTILCGPKHTLVHDSFHQRRVYKHPIKKIKSILITIGGADNKMLSIKFVQILKTINPKLKLTLVTTTSNPKLIQLKALRPTYGFTLVINTSKMAQLMKSHDIVITASGGTLFEVFSLNKPFINVNVTSNQDEMSNYLKTHKYNTQLKRLNYAELKYKLIYLQKHQASLLQKMTRIQFMYNTIAKEMRKIS